MAVGLERADRQFDRQNVDLADVSGTADNVGSRNLVERLQAAFDRSVMRLTNNDHVSFLGKSSHQLLGSPHVKVSGFLANLEGPVARSGMNDEHVQVLLNRESSTGSHIVVQQSIRQTEVLGARFQLHLDDDSRPYAVTGRPLDDLLERDPGAQPRTMELDALVAIRQHLKLPEQVPIAIRPIVFPLEGKGVWAFEGRCVLYDPIANIRAYVRADDLSLMLSFDMAAASFHGEAHVFPVNPLRTPDLKVVRLDQIGPSPSDRLRGPTIHVSPWQAAPLTHQSRDYRLRPTDAGFDEAHLFYHLQQALRYFGEVVDPSVLLKPPFAPIKAHANKPRLPETALYLPDTGELFFGEVESRSAARSADVIYHELAHAITDGIAHLSRWTKNSPARAMSEGYSDYFAASALEDPRVGDYLLNRAEGARDCSNPNLRFPPEYQGQEHKLGEVWASVLWGIRSHCGASVTDKLAAESLYFLQQNAATFEDGRAALLSADFRMFPDTVPGRGRHADIIEDEFDRRRP